MKLNKEQRAMLETVQKQAALAALKGHFTGEASVSRWLHFVIGALNASFTYFLVLFAFSSSAIIAVLLVGPEQEFFLKQFNALMLLWVKESAMVSLLLGCGYKLFEVVDPALSQATDSFKIQQAEYPFERGSSTLQK